MPDVHDPAAPQRVPAATCSQAPLPLQLPSLPQVARVHSPAGAATPAVTLAHVPSITPVSASVHASHVPLQAVLQQTPETQFPLEHWLDAPHAAPSASCGPQVPVGPGLTQKLEAAHCAPEVQLVPQAVPLLSQA